VADADANFSAKIRTRHLIRGALRVRECSLIKALRNEGVDPEKIPLYDEHPVPRRLTQAGIRSDGTEGDDLLDIEIEVEALCTVLASKDVKPPISLGLFGEWGSGKSFFMKKMEQRFKKLAAVGPDSAYCTNIVQLWFNAWHYMDTNLWASLATEIFDELAQELARQDAIAANKDPDYERARLVALKADANESVTQALQQKQAADAKVQASQQQLASIQSGETEVATDPNEVLREGYRFAVKQPEVHETIKKAEASLNRGVERAAQTLNIDPTDPAREKLLELQGILGYLRAIFLAIRNTKNKRRLVFRAIGFVVAGLGITWLLSMLLSQQWIQSAWVQISGVGLALLVTISPYIPAARKAVQILHDAIKANQESVEKAKLKAEKELQNRLQELQQNANVAQKNLDEATAKAKLVTDELEQLRSDRKMSNFIKQRQQSSDYTKYLGVIARARNDFEQLSLLLAKEQERSAQEQRKKKRSAANAKPGEAQKQPAESEALLPPIDRIILYIDDLDRCPERKVVDVLQAVHLLLAFPLFIVVVGVDPRWLLHSLRQHSKAFQNGGERDDSSEEDNQWRSTPLNYLEKIFQIPFTLNPIGKTGFGKMVDTLTEPPKTATPDNEPLKVESTGQVTNEVAEAKPEVSASASADQDPAANKIAAEQLAVAVPQSRNWATRLLNSLRNIFRTTKEGGDSALKDDTADETIVADDTGKEAAQHQQVSTIESTVSEKAQTADVKSTKPSGDIEPHPEHLLINSWEQNFMKELHELVPSPRATKRFINIYRLIRASVDVDEKLRLEEFTGNENQGKYRPVLLLLAILTGYPEQATEILRKLLEQDHPEPWWEFIDSFKWRAEKRPAAQNGATNGADPSPKRTRASEASQAKTSKVKVKGRGENGDPPDEKVNGHNEANADAESWEQLLRKLKKLNHLFAIRESCSDFVDWAPTVARYSFQSGRVLLKRTVQSSEAGKNPS
jgi:hypothetical protein